ncbi:hypothetical protein [Mycolicibacterium gadium]|uniref:Uncharacterized protein n=1 Tax=Mycolicibacterium gadium TaxID=1794 RepID=A0A7I7WU84_MYCGU|nr:hypothetical protein [Mycolicibacterium gadium]BBZ20602.1 hypothetical protein MGAD_49370 [Mycolicibacterium gadium]
MTPPVEPSGRPVDVDTGFWLWVASLPLLLVGHIIDMVATPNDRLPTAVLVLSILFVVVLAAVVLTFQILMRHGYRWARTVLTGGGVATVVYVATNLFTVRPTVAAMVYAVSGILGSVLIAGGVFLLHRKNAHAFFTR